MSRIVKLAAAAIALVLTAGVVGGVAYDRGRTDPRERSVRYDLSLGSPVAPAIAASVRGLTVRAQPSRYRLRLAPETVVEVAPRPTCHYLAWRATVGDDGR